MTQTDTNLVSQPAKGRLVSQRIKGSRDSLPGERNDLPPGELSGLSAEPQADENRDPPANAPTIPP